MSVLSNQLEKHGLIDTRFKIHHCFSRIEITFWESKTKSEEFKAEQNGGLYSIKPKKVHTAK